MFPHAVVFENRRKAQYISKFDGEFVFDAQKVETTVKASSAESFCSNETRLFPRLLFRAREQQVLFEFDGHIGRRSIDIVEYDIEHYELKRCYFHFV